MPPFYENRKKDYFYRSEKPNNTPLQCNAHTHRHTEFVYIKKGKSIAYADSESCELGRDDFFIAFPNQVHRFDTLEDEQYDLFIVNPELVPELASFFNNVVPRNNVIHNVSLNKPLYDAIRALTETSLLEDSELKGTVLKGRLLVLFGILFTVMSVVPYKKGDGNTLRTIVNYCSNHFTENLTLAILEEELHVSRHYISHLFGDKLNIGFNDFINTLRVTYASRLLRETNDSIINISESSGFNSLRTFNRAFKKHLGVSPREYRNSKTSSKFIEEYSPSLR